eukprot:jgi/Chrzof1/7022/Cz02g07280.t1
MTTPLVAGLGVAAAAYVGKQAIISFGRYKAAPRMAAFYKGGFLPEMTRREAALVLGLRESASEDKVKDAHRRIMMINHPDAGGSSYVAGKVNEAKDILLGKKKNARSVF